MMNPDSLQAWSRLFVALLLVHLAFQCGILPLVRMLLPGVVRPWRPTNVR